MEELRPFSDLEREMGRERIARSDERVRASMEDMLIAEAAKRTGRAPEDLASILGLTWHGFYAPEEYDALPDKAMRGVEEYLGVELKLDQERPRESPRPL